MNNEFRWPSTLLDWTGLKWELRCVVKTAEEKNVDGSIMILADSEVKGSSIAQRYHTLTQLTKQFTDLHRPQIPHVAENSCSWHHRHHRHHRRHRRHRPGVPEIGDRLMTSMTTMTSIIYVTLPVIGLRTASECFVREGLGHMAAIMIGYGLPGTLCSERSGRPMEVLLNLPREVDQHGSTTLRSFCSIL